MVAVYVLKMCGYVKSHRHKDAPRPMTEVYKNVMAELDSLDKQHNGQYKERVIGKNLLVSAPREYWDMSIIRELGISISEWWSYDDDDRAQFVAHQYLKSMLDVIEAYYRDRDEQRKNFGKKTK